MSDETTAPVRTYAVGVDGFPDALYVARTPGQARAQCWRNYSTCSDISFRKFLAISRIRRVPNPPNVGRRILVAGVPATQVLPVGQYVGFMRDGSDQILCSHPADVEVCNVG